MGILSGWNFVFLIGFVKDLKAAVQHVKKNPGEKGGMAPVYGMAATFPDRTAVSDMLDAYLDALYKV